jgi:hypothetical protein
MVPGASAGSCSVPAMAMTTGDVMATVSEGWGWGVGTAGKG